MVYTVADALEAQVAAHVIRERLVGGIERRE